MKKLIIISLTALVVVSCGDGKTEIQKSREAIDSYYENPALREHFGDYVVDGWHKVYERFYNNEEMLKEHQEFILNKVVDAEFAKTMKETKSN